MDRLSDAALLAHFDRSIRASTTSDHDIAAALLVKFRAAEERNGYPLPLGYAQRMCATYHLDKIRAKQIAERRAERAVVAAAEQIVEDARIAAYVATEAEFDTLLSAEFLTTLAYTQIEAIYMLRDITLDKIPYGRIVEIYGLSSDLCAQQRISRIRRLLRPHAIALGLSNLIRVALDSRISRLGGQVLFR